MTDLSQLTDEEINRKISLLRDRERKSPTLHDCYVEAKDYCNEWALAGELLEELIAVMGQKYERASVDFERMMELGCSPESMRRAIAEAYIHHKTEG